ncbi:hypothetical protein ACHAWF_000541 [Thalassiosira exigua]
MNNVNESSTRTIGGSAQNVRESTAGQPLTQLVFATLGDDQIDGGRRLVQREERRRGHFGSATTPPRTAATSIHPFARCSSETMVIESATTREAPATCLSALIVDFPSQPRHSNIIMTSASRRSVSFSGMSQLAFFEPSGRQESKELFYAREETRHFSVQAQIDAARIGAMMNEEQELSEEEQYEAIGVEKLLRRGAARRALESRRDHVRSVVARQHVCSTGELCHLSQESSRRSKVVARKMARFYWEM